ncbi:MAG: DUF2007 domain-containing protein [Gammaproteobacteria bacterium]|nr:DUF2007 domain-containing protein [Gammaproteobacteria bacterium]
MKRLYGSHDRMLVGHLRALLEAQGIACVMRNEYLGGGAGELPPHECEPELWVVDADDWERAKALVDAQLGPAAAEPWTCPGCGERIEGQFAQCWNCGREAPG